MDFSQRTADKIRQAAMGKKRRKLTAAEKAEKKRRRKEYMTVFIRGKRKRIRRPPTIEGMDLATAPVLKIANNGPLPVLILDGEEVIGGLQNRVLNTTILVAAKSIIDIPVSCVEHGRWHPASSKFTQGEAVYPTLRRMKAEQVSEGFQTIGSPMADQCAIWDEVARSHERSGTKMHTGAVNDVYYSLDSKIRRISKEFPDAPKYWCS
jgi:uncharacterized protein YnzC (UPF0291/DUF896 family)